MELVLQCLLVCAPIVLDAVVLGLERFLQVKSFVFVPVLIVVAFEAFGFAIQLVWCGDAASAVPRVFGAFHMTIILQF
jgi:hypothetical protein